MSIYGSLLTSTGAAALAFAATNGTTVQLSEVALGDANGTFVTPTVSDGDCVHEVYRAPINSLSQASGHPDWLIVELILPPDVGGFTIREFRIYDTNGLVIYTGNWAAEYKPLLSEGMSKDQTLQFVIEYSNVANITLLVDPNIVIATHTYVNNAIINHNDDLAAHGAANFATKVGVQGVIYSSATAGGTANAITASYTPAIATLVDGMKLTVTAGAANTGAVTFSPNGLTAASVVKGLNVALTAGDIEGSGHRLELIYSSSLTKWVLQNPTVNPFIDAKLVTHSATANAHELYVTRWYTTTGTAPAFEFTANVAVPYTAYTDRSRFRIKLHSNGAGSDSININALGTKLLKQYDSSGAKIAAVIKSGMITDIEYDGTDFIVLEPLIPDLSGTYATKVGVQNVSYSSATAGGSANVITASFTPAITTLTDNMKLIVTAIIANTSIVTFSPNGLSALPIVKENNVALIAGDIRSAGHRLELIYSSAWSKWVLQNPATVAGAIDTSGFATKVGVQNNSYSYDSTATGTANAITAAYTPTLASLVDGMQVSVKISSTNTTTTPTFAPNGLTPKTIVKGNNLPLEVGDLYGIVDLKYNLTIDKWVANIPNVKVSTLLNVSVFSTVGTSTYTATPGTRSVIVECVGGGGGSGGLPSTGVGYNAAASSGGAGAYGKSIFTSGFNGVTVTIGAGGAGGVAGANNGSNGGTSSFGALLSCPGGNGSPAGIAVNAFPISCSRALSSASPSGANISSSPNKASDYVAMLLNGYTTGTSTTESDFNGTYGNGGRISFSYASAAATAGGAGASGVVVVYEYS